MHAAGIRGTQLASMMWIVLALLVSAADRERVVTLDCRRQDFFLTRERKKARAMARAFSLVPTGMR